MGALFTLDSTKIMTGAISTWVVKSGSASADGYVSLGELSDASVEVKDLTRDRSLRNPWPYGQQFTATAKMLGTAKTSCLMKMNLFNQYINANYITLHNGQTLGAAATGTTWRFVCEGGYDADRYIEITTDLSMPAQALSGIDYGGFWDPTIPTAATSADPLYGFATGDPLSAGWISAVLTQGGDSSTLGTQLRNTSLVIDPISTKNQWGESIQYGCLLKCSFDLLQTDETGILEVFDTMYAAASVTSLTVTLADSAVFTIPTPGLITTYNAKGNFDDVAFLRVDFQKAYTPAELVALIS